MTSAVAAQAPASRRRPRGAETAARLLQRPQAALAFAVIVLLVFGAVAAPLVAPYPKNQFDFTHLFAAPSWHHLFGTDELGRDLLTRVLYGGRTSIEIAALATLLAMAAGRSGASSPPTAAAGSRRS